MLKRIFKTSDDITDSLLRMTLGIIFFPHGAQKVFGWFGGYGLKATLAVFTDKMHIPFVLALLAIAVEFLGSLALILGIFTRLAAFGIAVIMVVAVYMVHWQNGFFMNWFGTQRGEGFEYHLLVIAMAVVLMIKGGGSVSLDRRISKG